MATSWLYELPIWVNGVLFVTILLLAVELGFWTGVRSPKRQEESDDHDISLGSMLAILGLLLAFTYAFTLSRADHRKSAIISEANAIGTAFLRADMAAGAGRTELRRRLLDYARTRVAIPKTAGEAREIFHRSLEAQAQLWPATKAALQGDLSEPIKVAIIRSINAVLDAHTARVAVAFDFLPPVVLALLLLIGAACLALAAQDAARTNRMTHLRLRVLALVLAALMLTIVDFDRPYEGFIQWSNQSLVTLVHDMEETFSD